MFYQRIETTDSAKLTYKMMAEGVTRAEKAA